MKRILSFLSFIMIVLMGQSVCFSLNTDSVKLPPNTFAAMGSSSCTYYAQDTYGGTELPGSGITYFRSPPYGSNNFGNGVAPPSPPLTNSTSSLNLTWTSGANSAFATPVPCTGNFVVYFTLVVEATDTNNPVNIRPCLQKTDGSVLYGDCTATSPIVVRLTPTCNGGDFCGTMVFNFMTKIQLNKGDMLQAPIIYSDGKVAITGGESIMYYLGP